MVHETEIASMEKLRDMDVPDDPVQATMMFYGAANDIVTKDGLARGAPMFDVNKVMQEHEFHAVEFMFPHFFLLPMIAAMSSYRIRPLTPETCLFEIWSLVLRPKARNMTRRKSRQSCPTTAINSPKSRSRIMPTAASATGASCRWFHSYAAVT